jgi:hypothetical protein
MVVRRSVPGYLGYEADSNGAIYRNGSKLNVRIDENGYRKVASGKSGQVKCATLVCMAFHGLAPNDARYLVAHWNDDPGDDRASNLRWATYRENRADAARNGKVARGSRQGTAKLTESDIPVIRKLYDDDEFYQYELAEMFGVCQRTINLIVNRKGWCHVPE